MAHKALHSQIFYQPAALLYCTAEVLIERACCIFIKEITFILCTI